MVIMCKHRTFRFCTTIGAISFIIVKKRLHVIVALNGRRFESVLRKADEWCRGYTYGNYSHTFPSGSNKSTIAAHRPEASNILHTANRVIQTSRYFQTMVVQRRI